MYFPRSLYLHENQSGSFLRCLLSLQFWPQIFFFFLTLYFFVHTWRCFPFVYCCIFLVFNILFVTSQNWETGSTHILVVVVLSSINVCCLQGLKTENGELSIVAFKFLFIQVIRNGICSQILSEDPLFPHFCIQLTFPTVSL